MEHSLSKVDIQKLKSLISQLDEMVPKENAHVGLVCVGGPSESEMLGNAAGYVRFGIELMKGGIADATDPESPNDIEVDLEKIIDEGSDVHFNIFTRDEAAEIKKLPPITWKDRFILVAVVVMLFAVGVLGFAAMRFTSDWMFPPARTEQGPCSKVSDLKSETSKGCG